MTQLIPDATAAAVRKALGRFLVHTYTRTPVTNAAEDAHGAATIGRGSPVNGVACVYTPSSRVRTEDGGQALISRPRLTVADTDPLTIGDEVAAITNAKGALLAAGPFEVGQRLDGDSFGMTIQKSYELLGADTLRGVG